MKMEDKEFAGLDQQINDISNFINVYQSLNEMQRLENCKGLDEYITPKLTSTWFTFHKKKDPKTGKFLDDGKCRVCGKDRQYLLIRSDFPPICERCYQAARGYKNLLFDPLKVKSKRDLNITDCKKIVKYMDNYAKKKLVALAAVGAYLAIKK